MVNFDVKYIRVGLPLLFALFCFWSLFAGFIAGRDLARSRATIAQARSVHQMLEFFYDNQSRYPGGEEFFDSGSFGVYADRFPGVSFLNKKWCQAPPSYTSAGGESFEYSFCLPRGFKEFTRGWHSFDERGGL